jgi:HSP20 family protein
MAEAAKLPVKTERKLSEPAPAMQAWWPIESLRREIDHLFDDFGGVSWRSPFRRPLLNHCGDPSLAGLPRRLST